MEPSLFIAISVLISAGIFAGIAAGLFGIGGGVIIVPAVYFALGILEVPKEVQIHLAIGTSVASILFTSSRSLQKHHEKGAVDWKVLKVWFPWIGMGAFLGAWLASQISGKILTLIFSLFLLIFSINFMLKKQVWSLGKEMPKGFPAILGGCLIGSLSSIMGIGGGVLGVTLMTGFGKPIHKAIGTASGFGLAIGLVGTIGYISSGWNSMGRPDFSLGYVSLPALAIIAFMTVFFAPLGVWLAHKLPALFLRRLFAIGLFLIGLSLLIESL